MKFKAPIEVESSLVDSSNSPGSAGQVLTSTGVGVDWIAPTLLPAESAEKVIQTVRMGEAVSKGDPLVITGYHGSNGPAIVERADATDDTTMPAYGVALEDYANNATGLMIAVGDFNDFDTSSYNVGDTLYVAVGGGMTNVKPTGTALIQNMGIVSRKNANNGDVEIVAIGRTNDVPNLPEGRLFVGTSGNTSLTSEVVYIDDTNNRVGIGTTSPGAKLEVVGSYGATPLKVLRHGNYGNVINMGRNGVSEGSNIGYPADSAINLSTNGSERMRIDSSGNIGIGTTSPSTKLQLGSYGVAGKYINQAAYPDIPSEHMIHIAAPSTTAYYGGGISFGEASFSAANIVVRDAGGGGALDLCFGTGTSSGVTEKMRIQNNGNVGIGTDSPAKKLHVQHSSISPSSVYGTLLVEETNEASIGILGTTYSSVYFGDAASPYAGGIIYAHGDNHLQFRVSGNSEKMRITSSGNVGIGTTSPGTLLPSGFAANTNSKLIQVSATSGNYDAGLLLRSTNNATGLDLWTDNTTGDSYIDNRYNHNNGDIRFRVKTSGTPNDAVIIAGSGDVGIGNTSPSDKLHVSAGAIRLDNFYQLRWGGTGTGIYGHSSQGLNFYTTSGTTRLKIDNSGNVGIGTTAPLCKLNIVGQAQVLGNGFYGLLNINGSNALADYNTANKIVMNSNGSTDALYTGGLHLTRRAFTQQGDYGSGIRGLSEGTVLQNNALELYTSTNTQKNTTRLKITAGGNVGIGTTSPASKLEIAGDTSNALLTLKSNNGGSNDAFMRFYEEGNGDSYSMGLDSSDGKFKIAFDSDGDSLTTGTKLVMDTSGNVGIGTTSPSAKLHITTTQYNTGCRIDGPAGTLSYGYMSFYSGTSYRGAISTTSTGVNYASASDYRLKENVTKLQNSTEKIKKLKPSNFNFLENPSETVDGFIAHELQEIVPEAVTGEKDAVGLDGKPSYQGVDQSKIVPLLTAALQEAISKIEQLETRIQTLENKKNGNNL